MARLHLKRCMRDLRRFGRRSRRRLRREFCKLAVLSLLTRRSFRVMNGFRSRVTGLNRIFVTPHTIWMLEKARVWRGCLARVQPDRELRVAESEVGVELPRYGSPVLIRPRLGQGAFRVSVTEAYN